MRSTFSNRQLIGIFLNWFFRILLITHRIDKCIGIEFQSSNSRSCQLTFKILQQQLFKIAHFWWEHTNSSKFTMLKIFDVYKRVRTSIWRERYTMQQNLKKWFNSMLVEWFLFFFFNLSSFRTNFWSFIKIIIVSLP